jgi:hypothetical protein
MLGGCTEPTLSASEDGHWHKEKQCILEAGAQHNVQAGAGADVGGAAGVAADAVCGGLHQRAASRRLEVRKLGRRQVLRAQLEVVHVL